MTNCTVLNSTAIACVTPPFTLNSLTMEGNENFNVLNYTVIMDNVPGPDLTMESLQIRVVPNPGNFTLLTMEYITRQGQPFMLQIAVCEQWSMNIGMLKFLPF